MNLQSDKIELSDDCARGLVPVLEQQIKDLHEKLTQLQKERDLKLEMIAELRAALEKAGK